MTPLRGLKFDNMQTFPQKKNTERCPVDEPEFEGETQRTQKSEQARVTSEKA